MDELKSLNLGKGGVKDSFIAEARLMLAKYTKLRVKVLKPALEGKKTSVLADEVASRTNSILVDVRGHTFVLARR